MQLATKLLPRPKDQVKRLGSVMVCEAKDVEEMRAECQRLQELGCECQWMNAAELREVPGTAEGFVAGIWFPRDAIIDSASYAQVRLFAVPRACCDCFECCWHLCRWNRH